jgi:ferric-dicitrate binding protein FerR (iron transport regulator)
MNERIEKLLISFFAGELNKSDEKELDAWKIANNDNEKLFRHYQYIWNKAKTFSRQSEDQVENALQLTKKRIPFDRRNKTLIWMRQIAAVLLVGFVIWTVWDNYQEVITDDSRLVYQEVKALPGVNTIVSLNDGTKVHLFPGSKLSYPHSFKGNERNVQLKGEGYFEVAHHPEMPFIVSTDHLRVRVLGTEFNLRAYEEEAFIETALVKGKVQLEKAKGGKYVTLNDLLPNQRSVYHWATNEMNVFNEKNIEQFAAWKHGKLVFDATSMEEVVYRLQKWYNVEIIIQDEQLYNYRFTGVFGNEPIQEVLELMRFTSPFSYRISEASSGANGKLQQRKIILTLKN